MRDPLIRPAAGLLVAWVLILAACPADPQAITPDTSRDLAPPGDPGAGLDLGALDLAPLPDPGPTDPGPPPPDVPSAETASDAGPPDPGGADAPAAVLPARACLHTFRYEPPAGTAAPTSVHVPGTFNGWDTAALPLEEGPDGVWRGSLDLSGLAPGSEGYKLLLDGADWQLDPGNMMRRFDEGVVNSKLVVPDCTRPALELLERTVDAAAGAARIEVAVERGVGGELDPTSLRVRHNFAPVAGAWDAARGTLLVDVSGLAPGKHTFRFDAAAGPDLPATPLVTSLWVEPQPFDWRDAVLYFAFVDRFRDEDPSGQPLPCSEADPLGNWRGGDWKGVTAALEEGYFDALGVNALWINAPMDNPDECVAGIGGYTYTAYHGYFPANLQAPEEHFGTLDDLRALVTAAHARGIRVLVDLVVNHVYETAPEWTEHQGDGWFNTPAYVCGWDQPETCWFQPYLPDLNHREDAVVERVSEAALWWVREADLDGLRVDAVKHVHPHLLNTLRAKLDRQIEATQDQPFWTVGETFTGGWGGGTGPEEALIAQYISETQLYGQFDFPLYWAITETLARHEAPLTALGDVLTGTAAYYGPDAIMASFLGNHDVARFTSHANGDIADLWGNGSTAQGWESPPAQPSAEAPYARLEQAFTFLAAAPWVPLIYYGDEIGLAGAGDPDNRRELPWTGLAARQLAVRAHVGKVMQARRSNLALRRGALSVVQAEADLLVVRRTAGASEAVAILNRGAAPAPVSVTVGAATFTEAVTGETLSASGGALSVTVPPGASRLLHTTP